MSSDRWDRAGFAVALIAAVIGVLLGSWQVEMIVVVVILAVLTVREVR